MPPDMAGDGNRDYICQAIIAIGKHSERGVWKLRWKNGLHLACMQRILEWRDCGGRSAWLQKRLEILALF